MMQSVNGSIARQQPLDAAGVDRADPGQAPHTPVPRQRPLHPRGRCSTAKTKGVRAPDGTGESGASTTLINAEPTAGNFDALADCETVRPGGNPVPALQRQARGRQGAGAQSPSGGCRRRSRVFAMCRTWTLPAHRHREGHEFVHGQLDVMLLPGPGSASR